MPVVVEGDVIPIMGINAGGGNNRPAEVTADVFYNSASVAEIWFCIDIKTVFIFSVNGGFRLFEGSPDALFQFI